MSFETFIARKHLTHRRKTGFISLVSLISIGGVAVGVMALIVVLAVMSGFDRELKAKIVNVQPHLMIGRVNASIEEPSKVVQMLQQSGIPGIQTVSRFVEGQGLIKSDRGATGAIIKGLDTEYENLSIYESHLKHGYLNLEDQQFEKVRRRFLFFKKKIRTTIPSIVIGEGLASRLRVRVGDLVAVIVPYQTGESEFSLANAEAQNFVVQGIFRLGKSDFDSQLALINLGQAQRMYHLDGNVTGISMRFHDVDAAEKWKFEIRGFFSPDYYVLSWYDMNHNFFQALKVEKSMLRILLTLIILVAAFNIVASLTMIVMEKIKDIGILRAIGASKASIRKIFILQGFSVGAMGVIGGAVSGLLIARNLNPISDFLKETFGLEIFPSDVYLFDRIPTQIHPQDVLWTVGIALMISILAGLYPAHRASLLNPIEALRYE